MVISTSNKILVSKVMECILLLPGATILLFIALVFETLYIVGEILACTFHNIQNSWLRFPALCLCAALPVFSVWLLLDKWQSCFERQS